MWGYGSSKIKEWKRVTLKVIRYWERCRNQVALSRSWKTTESVWGDEIRSCSQNEWA